MWWNGIVQKLDCGLWTGPWTGLAFARLGRYTAINIGSIVIDMP